MKLSIHKKALAVAVLVVVSGSLANAAGGKQSKSGTSTTRTRTSAAGTTTKSQQINKGASTTAAPAEGNFRRARVGFGQQSAPVAAKPAAAKPAVAAKPAASKPAPRVERPRVSTVAASSDTTSPVAKTTKAITDAGLEGKLKGRLPELSAILAKDAVLAGVAAEIVSTNAAKPQLATLNQARVEGLLNISKLSSAVRDLDADLVAPAEVAQQAYVALVQNAGREAAGWPAVTQQHMVELLTKTNDKIAGGMSVAEAIEASRVEMLTVSKVNISLEQIKRLCGKV